MDRMGHVYISICLIYLVRKIYFFFPLYLFTANMDTPEYQATEHTTAEMYRTCLHLTQASQTLKSNNVAILSKLDSIQAEVSALRAEVNRISNQNTSGEGEASVGKEPEPRRTILHPQVLSKKTHNPIAKRVCLDDVVEELEKHGCLKKEEKKIAKHNLKFAARHIRGQVRRQLGLGKDDLCKYSELSSETIANAAIHLEEMSARCHIPLNRCAGHWGAIAVLKNQWAHAQDTIRSRTKRDAIKALNERYIS